MPDAYAPYRPLNTLKPVADGVWIVDGPEIRFRLWGLSMPFPTRMTVVRLPDGGVWIHSPTEPHESLLAEIAALGRVTCLVAPNAIHYWWLPAWHERFPDAALFAVPELRRTARRDLPPYRDLSGSPPPEWRGVIDQVLVEGGAITEAVFFHRPTRTLILTDLIENFEPSRFRSWFYRWLTRLGGVTDPDGKMPIDLQLSFWRQRDALKAADNQMIAWNPERVILAHGRWFERDGAAELRRAFRWVL